MVFEFTNVNWIAVLVAAAAAVVIGFVWYMPATFGKRWAASIGRELPTAGDVNPVTYLVSVVQALVVAYVLALLIGAIGTTTLVENLVVAFVLWVGFAAVPTLNAVVYERRGSDYWLINVGYALVSLLVMAAIYALI
jgi:hypothetical protein